MHTSLSREIACAAVMTMALVLTACGDDDSDGRQLSTSEPTGAPVELGLLNVENSPAGSYPETREGAEAAVEYVNAELGGIDGRPLHLESCISDGSGESSIDCANKFVETGKVAVIPGIDFGADGSVPVLEKAGIPYVGGLAVQPAALTSPNSFTFVGAAPGAVSALARYIGEDLKAKNVSILRIDIPAAAAATDAYAKPILTQLGTTKITEVTESPTAADYTPALTKANEGDPDAILVIFGGSACSGIMQAAAGLGVDPKKMLYTQTCSGQDLLTAGGAGAEGARFNSPYLVPASSDSEVAIYLDQMDEYAPHAALGSSSQNGFSSVMNVYAQLKAVQGEINKVSLTSALQAARNAPNFMGHPYSCDGAQVPGLPSTCNAFERIVAYENGELTDVKGDWIEGVTLLGG